MDSIQGSTIEGTSQDETIELLEELALEAPVSEETVISDLAAVPAVADASAIADADAVVDAAEGAVVSGPLDVSEPLDAPVLDTAVELVEAAEEAVVSGPLDVSEPLDAPVLDDAVELVEAAEEAVEFEPIDVAEDMDLIAESAAAVLDGAAGGADDAAELVAASEVEATEPAVSAGLTEVVGQADMGEMGGLPVADWDYQRPKRGQIRTGVILSIGEQEIVVDVDAKRDGIVPYADMQRLGEEAVAALSPGDEVTVYILRPEDQDGNLLVSLFQARQSVAWEKAAKLAESGDVWEGEVEGYNKGGLVIPIGEIRGFVPASQVPGFPQGLNQEERLRRLSTLVGEKLMVKVIEINKRNRRLILSATAAQREWRQVQRERLLDELREGEVRKGSVSSLCAFGAFVDLGGADGLVHLSELSWRRVRHPREVVRVGQDVEVYVLRLDRDKKRIGLSLKRLQPEPWALVEDKYELGQLVEGLVTNVTDFGAFAEIEEGVEGLIHVSELTDGTISHPREVVKKRDLLLLRIIRIDIRRRRLGLSLKRVLESEWAEWAAQLAVHAEEEEPEPVAEEEVDTDEQVAEPMATEDLEQPSLLDAVEEEEPTLVPPDAPGEVDEPAELEELEPLVAELAEELEEPESVEVEGEPELPEQEEAIEADASEQIEIEVLEPEPDQPFLPEDEELDDPVLDESEEPEEDLEQPPLSEEENAAEENAAEEVAEAVIEAIEAEAEDAVPGVATEE